MLAALRRAGAPYELSPGRLLRETLVTSGTMTNRVDRLAARGLVTRLPDPNDRRGVLVRLTRAGRYDRRRRARGPAGPRAGPARRARQDRPAQARRAAADAGASPSRTGRPPAMTREIWLRFLSGPDIDSLGHHPRRDRRRRRVGGGARTAGARRSSSRACTWCRTTAAPVTSTSCAGHVSTLGDHGVSGIKVVGDFVPNYERGLPSELGLATLYDPRTGRAAARSWTPR